MHLSLRDGPPASTGKIRLTLRVGGAGTGNSGSEERGGGALCFSPHEHINQYTTQLHSQLSQAGGPDRPLPGTFTQD